MNLAYTNKSGLLVADFTPPLLMSANLYSKGVKSAPYSKSYKVSRLDYFEMKSLIQRNKYIINPLNKLNPTMMMGKA